MVRERGDAVDQGEVVKPDEAGRQASGEGGRREEVRFREKKRHMTVDWIRSTLEEDRGKRPCDNKGAKSETGAKRL